MDKRTSNTSSLLLATCLFVAGIVLVNTTITHWRLDLTENKLFTLSDGTVNILGNLDEPITLNFYFSQKELTGIPSMLNYGIRVRDPRRWQTDSEHHRSGTVLGGRRPGGGARPQGCVSERGR